MITIQILQGLQYLHKEKKVIHRDIKPHNILLNTNGAVKIADFGVSGVIQNTIDCMTSWIGTATYMSPERLLGENYFADIDIWSLGMVLLEAATGRYPFQEPGQESKVELGFWQLVQFITTKPSPVLPND